MRPIWIILALATVLALSGCSSGKFPTYRGPEVTQIVVNKADRQMYLLHHDRVLKAYDVSLGFNPEGHKQVEGDGRTPEGDYLIDRRNPNSAYYLSLGIDYPRPHDIARAEALGLSPGGDIFIHGRPNKGFSRMPPWDWTAGCIAVSDRQMREIYAMVRDGTPIRINP